MIKTAQGSTIVVLNRFAERVGVGWIAFDDRYIYQVVHRDGVELPPDWYTVVYDGELRPFVLVDTVQ